MASRNIITFLIAIVTLLAAGVFFWTFAHAVVFSDPSETEVPDSRSLHAATSSLPTRLRVPAIGIDAAVQHVGVAQSGNMAVPTNYTDVGWYKYGTLPGQLGSAVIDGHVDNGLSLPGVFKHLGDIALGDSVYVDTEGGTTLHYVVVEIQSYPYTDAPLERIFNRGDAARLNLITCEGKWVKDDKTYDQRLVVYTELKDVID